MKTLIEINGMMGEGGGQVLRSSLALSMMLGRPFKVSRIRGGRLKPGLKRQHLACVQAAQVICGAKVEGAEINSTEIFFQPGQVKAGDYRFDIGGGGSCTLVLQAALPALLKAGQASRLTVCGGTHVPLAPTFDFFQRTLLPRLEKMGVKLKARLIRPGFMQVGGGIMEVEIEPSQPLKPLEQTEIGPCLELGATVRSYGLDGDIAQREAQVLKKLRDLSRLNIENLEAGETGPGNMVIIDLVRVDGTTVSSGIAQRGLAAEKVARQALNRLLQFMKAQVPVDSYLADQLLVPMSLSGGVFITEKPSRHTQTLFQLLPLFTEKSISAAEVGPGVWRIEVPRAIP